MKNKKAIAGFGFIIAAVLCLVLLVIMTTVIKTIFVEKEINAAGGKVEEVTTDCDGDGVTGLSDQCPCNPDIQKLDSGITCGDTDDPDITEKCPNLCK